MTEPEKSILETVTGDIRADKGVKSKKSTTKIKKQKRSAIKLANSSSSRSKHAHVHRRGVTADVSGNILDQIQEESDVTVDNKNESAKEPKDKPNKILVRPPMVDIENNQEIGTCSLKPNSEDNVDVNLRTDKTGSKNPKHQTDSVYSSGIKLNTEVSFCSSCDLPEMPAKTTNSRKNQRRPKSSNRFTKEDLELFLPRKSFFDSQDRVLIEAGHHVDTHKERKKPDWRRILKMHTMEELYPVEKKEEEPNKQFGLQDDDSESEDEIFSFEKTETLVSKEARKTKSGKQSGKKTGTAERDKPLYDYLKYIHENPEEYVTLTKYTTKNLDYKHPNTMVRLGRVFRRGHHGNVRNSIYIHALAGLRTNIQEPSNTQDELEIVKLKTKAELWLKGLTTQQYLKAKEVALKDIGEEDMSYTKWWLAFKSCQYLRLPQHVGS